MRRPLTERENLRCKGPLSEGNDLEPGDKCPLDGCRGILEETGVTVFSPHHPTQKMVTLPALQCDLYEARGKKRCDFQYILKSSKPILEKWRAECAAVAEAKT